MPDRPADDRADRADADRPDAARPDADLRETTVATAQVYDGALLDVRRDEAALPDGTTGTREWINHPGASAVVPLLEGGDTLLVRQFRYAARRTFLEVPAGKIDRPDEAPLDVAARELEEETGWRAATVTPVGRMYPCIGYSNEVIHVFVATGLEPTEQDLSEGEFIDVVRLPFAEAVSMARTGTLLDAKTVTALTLAAAHVEKQRRLFRTPTTHKLSDAG
jgi:ADP-ribose pyrophosphatase